MRTKQTIAVIGASGKIGSAISKSLCHGNYRLLLFGKDKRNLGKLEREIHNTKTGADVEVMNCSYMASWEADIIIVAVPFPAEKEIAAKIREVANQKIIVSISNPLNDALDGLITLPDTSAAEELQKLLPHSKVVKAFNTTFADNFNKLVIDGKLTDVFIAGDDQEAVETVKELVQNAGFNGVVAGGLSVSRTLEQMQVLLIRQAAQRKPGGLPGWKILQE